MPGEILEYLVIPFTQRVSLTNRTGTYISVVLFNSKPLYREYTNLFAIIMEINPREEKQPKTDFNSSKVAELYSFICEIVCQRFNMFLKQIVKLCDTPLHTTYREP